MILNNSYYYSYYYSYYLKNYLIFKKAFCIHSITFSRLCSPGPTCSLNSLNFAYWYCNQGIHSSSTIIAFLFNKSTINNKPNIIYSNTSFCNISTKNQFSCILI